ncbi:hypothetical protein DFH09DRAFT_1359992 [Mycena vulgaris]|nr:hypothetical protein DFH09DRAFT_1359992 [Mycena vulgaris]
MDVDMEFSPCHPHPSLAHNRKITLENAFSAADLLFAVRDIVSALKHLLEQKIAHKHIAFNNLLIQGSGNEGVKGLVIDLDFPSPADGSSRDREGFGVCNSFLFQSAQQLIGHGEYTREYRFQDDFESVFYALCWACYGFDHTGRPDKFRPAWMAQWAAQRLDANSFGYVKRDFKRNVIAMHVNRYMGCHRDVLEGVIEELRECLTSPAGYNAEVEAYYDAILQILDVGIAKLKGKLSPAKRKCCSLEDEEPSKANKRLKVPTPDSTLMDDE